MRGTKTRAGFLVPFPIPGMIFIVPGEREVTPPGVAESLDAPLVTGEQTLAAELRKRRKRALYLGDL